jgi:DNA-binding transcriptional MerR regulator
MAPVARTVQRAALIRRTPRLLSADALARDAGVHPEILRRFVQLGLLEPRGGTSAAPLFRSQDALIVARAMRLRRDLGVNYAGAVLASELLTRIDQLEQRLRAGAATQTEQEVIAWTRTV